MNWNVYSEPRNKDSWGISCSQVPKRIESVPRKSRDCCRSIVLLMFVLFVGVNKLYSRERILFFLHQTKPNHKLSLLSSLACNTNTVVSLRNLFSFCNFKRRRTAWNETIKSCHACRMYRSHFIHYHLFLSSLRCLFLATRLCPRVPLRTSIPVWLDLKGQLEGWRPSLTSEGWRSRRRSAAEGDESRNCRWGRAAGK